MYLVLFCCCCFSLLLSLSLSQTHNNPQECRHGCCCFLTQRSAQNESTLEQIQSSDHENNNMLVAENRQQAGEKKPGFGSRPGCLLVDNQCPLECLYARAPASVTLLAATLS